MGDLPENCDLTSRLDLDARLYEAPPVRKPSTNGRPVEAYVKLVKVCNNNMRAVLQRIEAGEMLDD